MQKSQSPPENQNQVGMQKVAYAHDNAMEPETGSFSVSLRRKWSS